MINKKNLELKLIDFGSTVPLTSTPTTIFYGTQKFSSPEALCNQSYVLAEQEIWALGTLLYVLLFKMDPFANDEEIMDLDISIRMHALRTRPYGKNNPPIQISDDAAESIIQMLSKNPEDRPRVENLMELPIFHNQNSDDD
jgi:serine/threonine protein kinase